MVAGDIYYMRLMLNHRESTCFEDVITVDGVVHECHSDACDAIGLLFDDGECISSLKEASMWGNCKFSKPPFHDYVVITQHVGGMYNIPLAVGDIYYIYETHVESY